MGSKGNSLLMRLIDRGVLELCLECEVHTRAAWTRVRKGVFIKDPLSDACITCVIYKKVSHRKGTGVLGSLYFMGGPEDGGIHQETRKITIPSESPNRYLSDINFYSREGRGEKGDFKSREGGLRVY